MEEASKLVAVQVRTVPIVGEPVHWTAGHIHDGSAHDYIDSGADAFGPLGYALLRSEAFTGADHRETLARALDRRFLDLAADVERVRQFDATGATKLRRQRLRLLMWDLVGLIAETCEQLACLFTAIRSFTQTKADIASTMLGFTTPAHRVFKSSPFQDVSWWRNQLGLEPDASRVALLSADAASLLRAILGASDTRLSGAIQQVATFYTPALHRVAVRRRHAASLLDPELGLAWFPEAAADRAILTDAMVAGALVVADLEARPSTNAVELIVLPAGDGVEALFALWSEANWLCRVLATSALGRVENPAGVVITSSDTPISAPPGVGRTAMWDLMTSYEGIPPEDVARMRSMMDHNATVWGAAQEMKSAGRRQDGAGRQKRSRSNAPPRRRRR